MAHIFVHLLGNPYVEIDGAPVSFPYKKMEALFYYLCVRKTVTRQEVVQIFWADTNETSGRKNLREAIYQLKKTFGPDFLAAKDRTHLTLSPELSMEIDWDKVTPDTILDYGDTGILSHFHVKNTYEFEEWMNQLQETYDHMYIQAMQQRLYQADAQKDMEQVKRCSQALIKKDPYNEQFYYEAMDICALNGHYNLAIRFYREMEKTFQQELELAPSQESKALYQRILHVKGNLHTTEKSTFFYGRTEEIYRISECISNFADLPPSPCLIFSGETGSGKSSLLAYGETIAQGLSCISLSTVCSPDDPASSWAPWGRLFRQIRQKHHLSFPVIHSGDVPYRDMERMAIETFEKVTSLSPVVLFIDDIHWMDPSGMLLLNTLLLTFGMHRIRLICTCQNGYEVETEEGLAPLFKNKWAEIISVPGFTPAETEEVLRHFLPDLDYDKERRRSIYTLTEGNINFLLEIIKIIKTFSYFP